MMQITIDVPERYLLNDNIREMVYHLKLYTALLMFRSGQLSAGAACEFADVDRYTFLSACKKQDIPVIDYEEGELEAEMERITRSKP